MPAFGVAVTIDQDLDARQARRMAAEDRFLGRREKQERKALRMIGELSSGRFYIFPVGGRYREAATQTDLIEFLIRNQYV
jgi:hypothetical protein